MKKNNREGSMVTAVITALIFFLILAIFGKSVQATERPTQKSIENSLKPSICHNVAKTENNSFTKRIIDHQIMLCKSTISPHKPKS